jgi:hypothetical protein
MFLLGVYVFVFSDTGFLERRNLQKKKYMLSERIQKLKTINLDLELRIEQYSKGNFTLLDILDSGYVPVGSITVYLENSQLSSLLPSFQENKEEDSDDGKPNVLDTESLRILWAVFSIFVMLAVFSRIYFKEETAGG